MNRFLTLSLIICTLILTGCTVTITPEASVPSLVTTEVEVLGVITVPNNTIAFETPVGGLSAVSYDPEQEVYYFLSDDRAIFGPSRIYQATIDLSDGTLDEGDLTWTGLIPLRNDQGELFARGALDPEGLVYTGDSFYVSTEGDLATHPPIAPSIIEFTPEGDFVTSLPLPEKFLPLADGSRGVRNNQGFESLTLTPDGRTLISGVESALVQDGPAATLDFVSFPRILSLDIKSQRVITEQVYVVESIPVTPTPASGDADNGLVELIALDDAGTLLAMERSYVQGFGNTVRLSVASPNEVTTNVRDLASLDDGSYGSLRKERVVDFGELGSALGIAPDNLEGMTLGPTLPDNRQLLLVVSDNNFNPSQTTQVWAIALPVTTILDHIQVVHQFINRSLSQP